MSDSFRMDDVVCIDHWLTVPLDYAQPNGPQIRIYGRELVLRLQANIPQLPWALFLQGGPGFESPRPMGRAGWLTPILIGHRLFLLDQRGTGRSSALSTKQIAAIGTPQQQAEQLRHYRQDNIVRDAEAFRKHLTKEKPWLVIGQSFGGFCAATYLSHAPEGIAAVILTGALPPVGWQIDDVYRVTYRLAERASLHLYERIPALQIQFTRLAELLSRQPAKLPNGGILTVRGLQSLGLQLYRAQGAYTLAYLLERAFPNGSDQAPVCTDAFLSAVTPLLATFASNPFFLLLHEAIYADGAGQATNWSAQRIRKEFPQFDQFDGTTLLLTAEHMYPWMADEFPGSAQLAEVAEILAKKSDWEPLYDASRLQANTIPIAAVVYYDDLCCGFDYSIDFANRLGGIKRWITSEFAHDGIHTDGEHIMWRLLGMLEGDIPSL
ncbi:alpha/beta fold hydrolase [Solimicrobium silvestre]|uniref:Alpha/beta hydrolase fold n=1 Tax=Solimicrobium silvestre TaxID=2099400 RepID=A0A2S9GXN5_9BURK|nr:alpha/beta fold hydrolase [Solimicrobium silvestre]PRC92471.1 alpha/beta hydrolase fold [Solimicrobium silvestre]